MPVDVRSTITVVSGLPRSGTSMMMNVLEAAGMPLLVDGVRQPDFDNPQGYFEYEAVKQLEHNHSWVHLAQGKAVKVIYRLLVHLPDMFHYRVIFMQRAIEEVLASQAKMVERLSGRTATGAANQASDRALAAAYRQELQKVDHWLTRQKHMAVLHINHRDMVQNPASVVNDVCGFLGVTPTLEVVVARVKPSLYRNRSAGASELA